MHGFAPIEKLNTISWLIDWLIIVNIQQAVLQLYSEREPPLTTTVKTRDFEY